jgi:hypothetical protein
MRLPTSGETEVKRRGHDAEDDCTAQTVAAESSVRRGRVKADCQDFKVSAIRRGEVRS